MIQLCQKCIVPPWQKCKHSQITFNLFSDNKNVENKKGWNITYMLVFTYLCSVFKVIPLKKTTKISIFQLNGVLPLRWCPHQFSITMTKALGKLKDWLNTFWEEVTMEKSNIYFFFINWFLIEIEILACYFLKTASIFHWKSWIAE